MSYIRQFTLNHTELCSYETVPCSSHMLLLSIDGKLNTLRQLVRSEHHNRGTIIFGERIRLKEPKQLFLSYQKSISCEGNFLKVHVAWWYQLKKLLHRLRSLQIFRVKIYMFDRLDQRNQIILYSLGWNWASSPRVWLLDNPVLKHSDSVHDCISTVSFVEHLANRLQITL